MGLNAMYLTLFRGVHKIRHKLHKNNLFINSKVTEVFVNEQKSAESIQPYN